MSKSSEYALALREAEEYAAICAAEALCIDPAEFMLMNELLDAQQ